MEHKTGEKLLQIDGLKQQVTLQLCPLEHHQVMVQMNRLCFAISVLAVHRY